MFYKTRRETKDLQNIEKDSAQKKTVSCLVINQSLIQRIFPLFLQTMIINDNDLLISMN